MDLGYFGNLKGQNLKKKGSKLNIKQVLRVEWPILEDPEGDPEF